MCGKVEAVDMSVLGPDGVVIGWNEAAEGRPLLLIHGGVSDAASWAFVRDHLPEVSGWWRSIGGAAV